MKGYLSLIVAGGIAVLFLNRLLTALLPNEPKFIELILFNAIQLGVLMFIGWATVRFLKWSILKAATIAGIVFAIDHFGLRTLYLLIILSGSEHAISYSMYGKLIWSFLFFVPIAMLLGAIGGFIAKHK